MDRAYLVIFLVIICAGCFQPSYSGPCGSSDLDDPDNDGWTTEHERIVQGTNPCNRDTDGDGLEDSIDPAPLDNQSDYDGDGALDQFDIDPREDIRVQIYAEYNVSGPRANEIWFYNAQPQYIQNATAIFDRTIYWDDNHSYMNIVVHFSGSSSKQYANLTVEIEGTYYYNGTFEDNIINATVVTSRV